MTTTDFTTAPYLHPADAVALDRATRARAQAEDILAQYQALVNDLFARYAIPQTGSIHSESDFSIVRPAPAPAPAEDTDTTSPAEGTDSTT